MAIYYPPIGFHFSVVFELPALPSNDAPDSRFQSVSGLSVDLQTETYKEGGENRFEHTLPVRTSYPNLVLKRGMLVNSTVIAWCMDTFNNLNVRPINLVVTLLNEAHQPLMGWNIVNAYPVKWSVSEFNAQQNNLVIETMELRYQYFRVIAVSSGAVLSNLNF